MKICAGLLLCLLAFACASGPVPNPNQGQTVFGSWKAWGFTNDSGSFYLVDTSVLKKANLMQAIHDSRAIFRRFSTDSAESILQPLGVQADVEKVADAVCSSSEAFPHVTPEEFYRLSAYDTKGTDISNSVFQQVFSSGTVTANIEFPINGEVPRVASAVVSCRDPKGARFAAAQARGEQSLVIITESVAVMRTMKLKAAELAKFTTKKDKDLLRLRMSRFLVAESEMYLHQYEVALNWLESAQAKAAFDTPEAKSAKIYELMHEGMLKGKAIMTAAITKANQNTDKMARDLASTDSQGPGGKFDNTIFDKLKFESE
jgi:hypothetical protein